MTGGGLQATVLAPSELVIGEPIRIALVISNESDHPVTLPNPDMGSPPHELAWTFDEETYQAALLRSFGLLALTVVDSGGKALPDTGPTPWTTPIMKPDLALLPGGSLEVPIILSDFVSVEAPGIYRVEVSYGREGARISAHADLRVRGPSH
jgi:hypothetical protein